MLKSLLLLFIWALILSMSSPSSSSLAHCHERSVRGARNAAMESLYASPRRHRLAANPFQEVGNLPRVTLPRFPPLDQERAALRDADRERQEALQETPSRRYRRVPRREEENRAVSPTPGLRGCSAVGISYSARLAGAPAVANKWALAQRARRDRENAAKTAAAAGPSTSTGASAPALGAREREQAAAAAAAARILTPPQTQGAPAPPPRLFIRLPARPARAPSPADDDDEEFPRYICLPPARQPRAPSPDDPPLQPVEVKVVVGSRSRSRARRTSW
ncbi:hypothetical protein B0H13DRAFT_1905717 [Mycena leptocephala]|nr:hypothetical protein B0H13DRAFT_1905717 [Mycena leptocephala]